MRVQDRKQLIPVIGEEWRGIVSRVNALLCLGDPRRGIINFDLLYRQLEGSVDVPYREIERLHPIFRIDEAAVAI